MTTEVGFDPRTVGSEARGATTTLQQLMLNPQKLGISILHSVVPSVAVQSPVGISWVVWG